jgi:hypothetical protein
LFVSLALLVCVWLLLLLIAAVIKLESWSCGSTAVRALVSTAGFHAEVSIMVADADRRGPSQPPQMMFITTVDGCGISN